jgi:hypothetical protein
MDNFSVMHWSSMSHEATEVLNLAGPVTASEVLFIFQFSSAFVLICENLIIPFPHLLLE